MGEGLAFSPKASLRLKTFFCSLRVEQPSPLVFASLFTPASLLTLHWLYPRLK